MRFCGSGCGQTELWQERGFTWQGHGWAPPQGPWQWPTSGLLSYGLRSLALFLEGTSFVLETPFGEGVFQVFTSKRKAVQLGNASGGQGRTECERVSWQAGHTVTLLPSSQPPCTELP